MKYADIMESLLQPTAPDEEEVLDEDAGIYNDVEEDEDEYYEDEYYEDEEDEDEEESPPRLMNESWVRLVLQVAHETVSTVVPALNTRLYSEYQRMQMENKIRAMHSRHTELMGYIESGELIES